VWGIHILGGMRMYKILIVEDDGVISKVLQNTFITWGMDARGITNFRAVVDEFREYAPHLVLLDISLPFYNGYYWCNEIRKFSKVPIVFISSTADNMNIVMAMNMGADDFIVKPFDLDVINAKVQALLRRTYDFSIDTNTLEYHGVTLNLFDSTVTFESNTVTLTKNELKILQVLMQSHGKIVSRDTLMEKLWETSAFIDDNTLTVNVNRLRKTLLEVGVSNYVDTRKGLGYIVP
jgi:DNA-binding response OmpR family regulator